MAKANLFSGRGGSPHRRWSGYVGEPASAPPGGGGPADPVRIRGRR